MNNRYNELTSYQKETIDQIINAIASHNEAIADEAIDNAYKILRKELQEASK